VQGNACLIKQARFKFLQRGCFCWKRKRTQRFSTT
jgi:hypothetical protein